MDSHLKKKNGVHFTPSNLAAFLASQILECILGSISEPRLTDCLKVLDPACGDGELLTTIYRTIQNRQLVKLIELVGFDVNRDSVAQAEFRLNLAGVAESGCRIQLDQWDFLDPDLEVKPVDVVIANPPYVRTQVMGHERSQQLADQFGLDGRVDLYQAFTAKIAEVLVPGGTLGLLTSNRFLTTKSGKQMRRILSQKFDLYRIIDLGDSKLFQAAVLPVIVIGKKRSPVRVSIVQNCEFYRIYLADQRSATDQRSGTDQRSNQSDPSTGTNPSVLDYVSGGVSGILDADEGRFRIEKGQLSFVGDQPWALSNLETTNWLQAIRSHSVATFGDLADVRVGIKTTADRIFIRECWQDLSLDQRPEKELLQPLLTHHHAKRWVCDSPVKTVLYPYQMGLEKRTLAAMERFPRTLGYLEAYRDRLEGRKYLTDAGRRWFEIWVAHQPFQWQFPKIVWPDISEDPKFYLDRTGAIVNGDCYWMQLKQGLDEDWLYLLLGVANSSVALQFYDSKFHNKLYSGRRRFMTQYVQEFPVPDLSTEISQAIVATVKRLIQNSTNEGEAELDDLI
ncbi:MAG: N-6 DNA methylase, partial [Planctomycetota bacterium]